MPSSPFLLIMTRVAINPPNKKEIVKKGSFWKECELLQLNEQI